MSKSGKPLSCDKNEELPLLHDSERHASKWKGYVLKCFLMVFFVISYSTGQVCKSQMIYRRITMQSVESSNNKSDVICGEVNGSYTEDIYQTKATDMMWHLSLVENGIALPMIIVLGIYSDRIGRKYCMLITLATMMMKQICMTLTEAFNLKLNYLYIGFAISGLGGSVHNFFAAVTASLADSTTPNKQRSIAFAVIYFMSGIGLVISGYTIGYVIKYYGFVLPLACASGMTLMEFLLVVFLFHDELKVRMSEFKNILSNLKDIFANKHNNHYPLWIYFVYVCAIFFCSSPNESREDIETLFMLRSPFCWGSEYIGHFQSVESAFHMLGGPLLIAVLQTCVNDETIACLGVLSGMAFYTMFAFAVKDWMIFTGAAIGVLCISIMPCIKASISKITPPEAQGSIFAIVYISSVAASIAGSTVFNNIYAQTQSIMPGLTFLVMAGFNLGSLFFIVSVIVFRKSKKGKLISTLVTTSINSSTNSP